MSDPDDEFRSSRFPPGWWVPFLLCIALGMVATAVVKIVLEAM